MRSAASCRLVLNPHTTALPAALTLSGVSADDAGSYTVVVTNAAGSDTSSNAVLTVTAPAEDVKPVVSVKGPKPGDFATNQMLVFGQAADTAPGAIARVMTRVINGGITGSWQLASLTRPKPNTANWTSLVTLGTGTNTVEVMAQDDSLNDSILPNPTVKLFYQVPGVLTLVTNGSPVMGSMVPVVSAPAFSVR